MNQPETSGNPVMRALMSHGFAGLVLVLFLAVATALRVGLIQQDNHQIQTHLQNEARALANSLEREFMLHMEALGRIARRLHANPATEERLWRQDVQQYLRDFGSYQAIEWIDRDYVIRWLEPIDGNLDAIGQNVAEVDRSHVALERAAETGQYYVSGILDLIQGGEGIVIYQPVGRGTHNNGFIGGVFRMDALARQLLTQRVLEQFQITIAPQGERAYQLNSSATIAANVEYTVPVVLPRLAWSLTLAPTTAWVERQRSDWPNLTFASLLLMGLLTSLTILLAQLILKRNQALLKTRQELDQEIEQRKAVQHDLERLESTDPLTGLANRRFFMEDLAHTIHIAERQTRQLALIMIDLDRFQMLNDSLGHQFGDELLIRVSERLNQLSNERILVAYSGGDEFMVCQQQVDSIDDVIHLLGQIKSCFSAPFEVQGNRHGITATMGVAVYPQSGRTADTLLRNADIALYRAKEQGRGSYQFYTEGMQNREVLRLELDQDLSQALANNEFVLHYQPQLNLDTGEITSVEALIRWQHPRRGLLPPGEFIPLAEESGRITEIGQWVVRAACRQLASWHNTPCEHLRIAVNLSGRELDDDALIDDIQATLAAEGISPAQLEVELTEEIFIQNIEHNLNQLQRLNNLGINLAIDDFGVGYSSLAYLRDFPVSSLKIDRSFITNVTERHDNAVITRAVINLAHNLGIKVVAEGVETDAHLRFLTSHRCDFAQGYLISKPLIAADLEQAIAEGILVPPLPAQPQL